MSITVTQVQSSNDIESNALTFVVDSDITGSFSADDRITITNSGTTFQNLGGVSGAATTLNNASGGTSDFQIRNLANPWQGQAGKTGIILEANGGTTLITVTPGGQPTDGAVSGLTFAAYSGGGGGGGDGSGSFTIRAPGQFTIKGNGKFTVK
jgi:hypothetical protein